MKFTFNLINGNLNLQFIGSSIKFLKMLNAVSLLN